MGYNITLIPGDGIGPEVTEAARLCIDALGLDIRWEVALAGENAERELGQLLPESTLQAVRRNKIALKGPISTPVGGGFRSINVAIRQKLDLYACLRPAKSISGIPHIKYDNVDILIVRENSEDLYSGVEFEAGSPQAEKIIADINSLSNKKIRNLSAISIKPISDFASRRISEFAFQLAKKEKRGKVTCVHKANIMKYTDGLFLDVFYQVAKRYPEIKAEDIIVDNLSMQLVLRPHNFDILVLPNLYGDIISDLCAGLTGGLGVAAGANIGDEIAVFEPVHGSAPKYAGKNKVNPTATILSAAMMLSYMGEHQKAKILQEAVFEVIKEGKDVTYDLKPSRKDPSSRGTKEMAQAVADKIRKRVQA